MTQRNELVRRELLDLAAADLRLRERLAADGSLYEGYHPEMEAVHRRNAARFATLLDEIGWPVTARVSEDGAQGAWLIAQHAIGEPEFQRRCLRLLQAAAASGDVPAWQPAMLEDRVRLFEGRPQRYGTQLEPDEKGNMQSYWTEDPEYVDVCRHEVGLEPLKHRFAVAKRAPLPRDRARFAREYEAWLRRVGWRQ